jgi:hypothetical protein
VIDWAALVRLFCHPAPLRSLELAYTAPIGTWQF